MSLSYTNYIFFLILWYIVPAVFIVPGRVRAERRRRRGDVAYDRRVAGLRSKPLAEMSSGRVTSAGGRAARRIQMSASSYTVHNTVALVVANECQSPVDQRWRWAFARSQRYPKTTSAVQRPRRCPNCDGDG